MKSNENMAQSKTSTVLQWNCRSISTNFLLFEQFVSKNDFCVLALQSLNVSFKNLPKIKNYYYPPLSSCDKDSKKIKSAIYIREDIQYSSVDVSPFCSNIIGVFFTCVCVKLNNSCNINIASVYYPTGPLGDNTDWLKNFNFVGNNWLILGDFNSHSTLWEPNCSVTSSDSKRLVENILDSY
jgi:hypothetical protein